MYCNLPLHAASVLFICAGLLFTSQIAGADVEMVDVSAQLDRYAVSLNWAGDPLHDGLQIWGER